MSKTLMYSKTPVVEATPDYSDGDVIGGKMTLAGVVEFLGNSGAIRAASVHSLADLSTVPIRVLIFNADPTASTITENAAFVLHTDDVAKLVGVLDLSVKAGIGTPDVLFADNPHLPFVADGVKDLYAVAIAGGTINLGTVADLTFQFGIERH